VRALSNSIHWQFHFRSHSWSSRSTMTSTWVVYWLASLSLILATTLETETATAIVPISPIIIPRFPLPVLLLPSPEDVTTALAPSFAFLNQNRWQNFMTVTFVSLTTTNIASYGVGNPYLSLVTPTGGKTGATGTVVQLSSNKLWEQSPPCPPPSLWFPSQNPFDPSQSSSSTFTVNTDGTFTLGSLSGTLSALTNSIFFYEDYATQYTFHFGNITYIPPGF